MSKYLYYCKIKNSYSIFRYEILKETAKMYYPDVKSAHKIVNSETGMFADYNHISKKVNKSDPRLFLNEAAAMQFLLEHSKTHLERLRQNATKIMNFQEELNELQET